MRIAASLQSQDLTIHLLPMSYCYGNAELPTSEASESLSMGDRSLPDALGVARLARAFWAVLGNWFP